MNGDTLSVYMLTTSFMLQVLSTFSAHRTLPVLESLVTNPLLKPVRVIVVVLKVMLLEAKSPVNTTPVADAAASIDARYH